LASGLLYSRGCGDFMNRTQEYYDDYWSRGLGNWSPRDMEIDAFQAKLLADRLPRGGNILEVGCGDGRFGRLLSAQGVSYRGLDVSAEAVEVCRTSGLQAQMHDLNEPLRYDDDLFDAVIAFEVLEHLFRPDRALSELHRVVRSGGVILGSVPNISYLPNRLYLTSGIFSAGGAPATSRSAPWRDPHIRFFTPRTLRAMIKEVGGFSGVDVIGEPFRFSRLPCLYRLDGRARRWLDRASLIVGVAGTLWPSMFSSRIYFVAAKL
jgi:methionine biosynthesis protein MetW